MKVSNRTSRRKKQKIRENPEFHLPQSSLKTMINIIIGYTKMRGPATNKQIMELTGERINAVSLAQGFLVDLGIIEGDIQKSSTLLGRELGRSLINGAESDIKMNLMKVVEKSSFCLNLLDDINQNGKVTRGIFQNRIFYYAKYLDPGKDIRIGANTLINILVRSGYVTKSGNYYKVSGAYEEFKKNYSQLRNSNLFISEQNILELRKVRDQKFDLTRLVKYCDEINENFERKNYSAVIFLCRAVLDHCPPIFGYTNFESLCEQLPQKNSLRKIASHLNNSLKRIADHHIHKRIGAKEILPTLEEIDFKNEMNFLVGRIIEKLTRAKK